MGESYPRLPAGFVFGTSTASYQIEGAWDEDGKGPSIWDTFTAEPGRIKDGSSGEVACDHYHRYVEDVGADEASSAPAPTGSRSPGRGSSPTGSGPANSAGLDFYDRLVDELVGAGIEPMATLYHWDLPQALAGRGRLGGRARPPSASRSTPPSAPSGSVTGSAKWVPVNEPNVVTVLGHGIGRARARASSSASTRCPSPTTSTSRTASPSRRCAPTAPSRSAPPPTTRRCGRPRTRPEDVAAADLFDSLWNRIFADPMLLGRYPEGFGELLPVQDGDLATIRQPLDFYGFNYYNPMRDRAPRPTGAEVPVRAARHRRLPEDRLRLADRPRRACAR